MADDPFTALGLTERATAQEVRAARRRLAKRHHPDRGGDPDLMRSLNDATAAALRRLAAPAAATTAPDRADGADRADGVDGAAGAGTTPRRPPSDRSASTPFGNDEPAGVARDVPSFTVEALPVEAFEALLVVSTWLGEVLDDDPPYRLDVHLWEPVPSWCRLDLVPDAGASTVSITVGALDGGPVPDVELVRDIWIDQLNRLDWDEATSNPSRGGR